MRTQIQQHRRALFRRWFFFSSLFGFFLCSGDVENSRSFTYILPGLYGSGVCVCVYVSTWYTQFG